MGVVVVEPRCRGRRILVVVGDVWLRCRTSGNPLEPRCRGRRASLLWETHVVFQCYIIVVQGTGLRNAGKTVDFKLADACWVGIPRVPLTGKTPLVTNFGAAPIR